LLLYIVRHGEAEPKSSEIPDENRKLTARGRTQASDNLKVAKEIIGRKPDLILSSPLLRAKETAEIAKKIFGLDKFEVDEALEPEVSPFQLYRSLGRHSHFERAVIVSHQPLVSRILSGLLNSSDDHFAFSPGSIAIVEIKELNLNPKGVLLSLIPSH
jgi:phosphohistidine phosphatase